MIHVLKIRDQLFSLPFLRFPSTHWQVPCRKQHYIGCGDDALKIDSQQKHNLFKRREYSFV